MKKLSILVLSIFLIPLFSYAHSGRTDSSGCHTCRTNCPNWGLSAGEYHCHNAKAAPQPEEPVRSIYNASGAGKTIPAPEYKAQSNTNKIEGTNSTKITPKISTFSTSTASTSKVQENITLSIPEPQPVKSNWIKRFFSWLF